MSKGVYAKENSHVVARLKKARLKSGLSQEAVAKKLGKTQSYLSKVENGQRLIDVVELKNFSRVYKEDVSYFL